MYKIRLQQFEGPLDLLLFFIKRDELDIYDIPISRITKEFMEYLHLLEKLDLEVAGDFILMATTLMQIKVRMLLPREIDEKGEEIDPRADLVKALLEYKRYKEMTDEFSYMETNQKKLSFRSNFDNDSKEAPPDLDTLLKNVTIYDLMKAFKKALMEQPKEIVHEVQRYNVTLEEQINHVLSLVEGRENVPFREVVTGMREKIRIIVTFIAVLELIKMGKLGLRESSVYNEFSVYGLANG